MIAHSRPDLRQAELSGVEAVLRSGLIYGGGVREQFAEKLQEITGGSAIALFPTGRAAISAGLRALNLLKGGQVLVQTYVCDAVIDAIEGSGLEPSLCDIDDGWSAGVSELARKRTSQTVAIVLAPPFGLAPSTADVRRLGLPIILDLCQADPEAGLSMADRNTADLIALSFHPTKYICAAGGGALIDPIGRHAKTLAALARQVGDHAPFSDLQAAIGLEQIARLASFRQRRDEIAHRFLKAAPAQASDRLRSQVGDRYGSLFRLPFECGASFEEMKSRFAAYGVSIRKGVDQLAHRAKGLHDAPFPNALRAYNHTVSVPFYPALTDDEVEAVGAALSELL